MKEINGQQGLVLDALRESVGEWCSTSYLTDAMYPGQGDLPENPERVLRVVITNLRKKLALGGEYAIESGWRLGYKLVKINAHANTA